MYDLKVIWEKKIQILLEDLKVMYSLDGYKICKTIITLLYKLYCRSQSKYNNGKEWQYAKYQYDW